MGIRMVTVSQSEAAPQPLFLDFVNSLHWYEGQPIELIGSHADLAAWLGEHDLPARQLDAGCVAALQYCCHRYLIWAGSYYLIQACPKPHLPISAFPPHPSPGATARDTPHRPVLPGRRLPG